MSQIRPHREPPQPTGPTTPASRASLLGIAVTGALLALCSPVAAQSPAAKAPAAADAKPAAATAKPAAAATKATKAPPPSIAVRGAKGAIGTETLLTRGGEANTYHSTQARLTDQGRTFTQRAHLVLDQKGVMQTYDRWIDVKGATLRLRIFAHEGTWKLVIFGQPGEKNTVKELAISAPPVVFDERSPMVNGLAAVLAGKRAEVPFVRADDGHAGTAKITREALAGPAGKRYVRTTFAAEKLQVVVVRDSQGAIVHTSGPGIFVGQSKGFDPKALQPVATPPEDDGEPPAPAPSAASPDDAPPPPPPRDDPE